MTRSTRVVLGWACITLVAFCGAAADSLDSSDLHTPSVPEGRDDEDPILAGAVRLRVEMQTPDPRFPWQKGRPQQVTGSGVVIPGPRILTNAHVVDNALRVEVETPLGAFEAHVEYMAHEPDLAMLVVDDPEFANSARGVPLGELPPPGSAVLLYGFGAGDGETTIVPGTLLGVDIGMYRHSFENLLLARVDLPICQGCSGGALVSGGQLVGLAVQAQPGGPGYAIPATVMRHFLTDAVDGRIDGVPYLGLRVEAPSATRARRPGALVAGVERSGSAWGEIMAGDILLEIAGYPVAADRTVDLAGLGRVDLSVILRSSQVGDQLSYTVLRDGRYLRDRLWLRNHGRLLPGRPHGTPSYLVFAGLVFQTLTAEHLARLDYLAATTAIEELQSGAIRTERDRLVFLSAVMEDPVNAAAVRFEDRIIDRVNGVVPRDLRHLAALLDTATEPTLAFETGDGMRLELDAERCRAAHSRILEAHRVPRDRSSDLARARAIAALVR